MRRTVPLKMGKARRRRLKTGLHAGLMVVASLVAAAFALVASSDFARAGQSQVFIEFSITIAGIPVGNAQVSSYFDGDKFDILANGRTAGVSRLVSDGRGTFSTSGHLRAGKIVPSSFKMDTIDEELITKVRMAMSDGSIRELFAAPPLARKADRIPVEERHYHNILDPLSAFMVVLDEDGRIKPEDACNRTIPVFDGWQRFDVLLSFKEQRKVRLGGRDGYAGPVVICKARYLPIAGHRPSRSSTVYLQNNENMEMWLAPVAGVPVLVPVNIKIGTRLGPLTLAASIFDAKLGRELKAQSE